MTTDDRHVHRPTLTVNEHTTVYTIPVGPHELDNNAYLVVDTATGHSAIIDAAFDPDTLQTALSTHNAQLTTLITTHCHPDHWQGNQALLDANPNLRSYSHRNEQATITPTPTHTITDGDTITVGDHTTLHILTATGHKAVYTDHICTSVIIVIDDTTPIILTGDTLFPAGVGNTCGDTDAFTTLLHDVTTKLFDRYRDGHILPGHGNPSSLATERRNLPEWVARQW